MKFTKKELKPVIVLGSIFLVVAVLLAVVNSFTAPKIESDKQEAIQESLQVAMPGGEFVEVTNNYDLFGTTVTAVYENIKEEGGHVVTLSTSKGYTGNPILLTVGISKDGVITGATVTSNPESKGVSDTNAFFAALTGKDANETFGAELITGVTYSSTAVRNAALDAFKVLGFPVPELPEEPRVETFGIWSVVGIAVVVAAIGCSVAYIIVKRRKGI